MSKKQTIIFRRILILFFSMFMILGLFGCHQEDQQQEEIPVDHGGDNEIIEDDAEKEYIETYPRTKISFTYGSLYKGLLNPQGTDNIMVIPVYISGGDPIDDEFFTKMDLRLNGGFDESCFFSVRKYFQNASYGQVDMQFHIYPTYYYSGSLDTWDQFLWANLMDAYAYSVNNYVKDPSEYDSNGDGYLDGVMLVTNEPSWFNGANYTFRLRWGDESSNPPNALLGSYEDVHVNGFEPDSGNYKDNVVTHELSHAFGLEDYYDYYGMKGVLSHFDIMAGKTGDWNVYSKMAVGWLDPYVITPNVEKVTIKLRNSAEYPDAVLIPCGDWNGTPFDEYLLLDVFSDRGNNSQPFSYYYVHDGNEENGGVRLLHVDSRMARIDGDYSNGLGWLEDFDSWMPATYSDVMHAYSNSAWPDAQDRITDSPDRDENYRLLSLIPASGEEVENSYSFYSSYLFRTGDSFCIDDYSRFFSNYPFTNKRGTIDYRFTVDSYDDETKEAFVTIEKVH